MIVLAERRRSRSLRRRDEEFRMIMDVMEIQKYLPHRYPFLMVDGILEIERLKRIVGIKNVSATESHFQGHFPGQPVMPGEQLRLEMTVLSWRGDFCKLQGKALVDGQMAAEETLMCKMVDRGMAPPKELAQV